MDGQTLTNILDELHVCDDEDALNKIYDLVKMKRENVKQANADRFPWAVGQSVQLKPEHQNRKPYDAIGEITKINPKKLVIRFGMVLWAVPKTMVMIK